MKFTIPLDAAVPGEGDKEWSLFNCNEGDSSKPILLTGEDKSCYLIGSDKRVCDIYIQDSDHQHCVIQFRETFKKRNLSA